jgi:hypothetical protein
MQPCNRIHYSKTYWRLNMFRAAYRSSSGAPNCICSLWFIYTCGDRPLSRLGGNRVPTQPGQQLVTATCWAFSKFWNNEFFYKVASCWLFLLIHTTMHRSTNIKFRITTFWTTLAVSLSKLLCQPIVVLDILSCFVTKGIKKAESQTRN